jgi:hypothetical protein
MVILKKKTRRNSTSIQMGIHILDKDRNRKYLDKEERFVGLPPNVVQLRKRQAIGE